MTRSRFLQLERKLAERTVADRTLNNINVLYHTLNYCAEKGYNYRISSNVMPLATLPELNLSYSTAYNFKQLKSRIDECAKIIEKHNIRCSTHPDQFVVPASANPDVVSKSILELNKHAELMDMLGLPCSYTAPINIHMNCYKGDTQVIADRFLAVYDKLNTNVKNRLVLENEDKGNSWSVYDLYNLIYKRSGIPITYDSHHFRLNNRENVEASVAIELCISTWGKYKPLFHFSNGKDGADDNSHSEFVYTVHDELFNNEVDIDFEFKGKDFAIEKFVKDFKGGI